MEADELAVIVPREQGSGAAVVAETVGRIVGAAGTDRVPAGRLRASVGVAPVLDGSMASGPLTDLARRSMIRPTELGRTPTQLEPGLA